MSDETAAAAEAEPTPDFEPTADAAIDRAFEAVDLVDEAPDEPVVEEPAPEPEAKEAEEEAPDRARNPDGTFKAKEAAPEAEGEPVEAEAKDEAPPEDPGIKEAPARFSADAKADWAKASPSVRGEVNRLMREMQGGLEEHQARWEPLKEYDALTKQHGTDIPTALRQYVSLEQEIRRDPISGLTRACADMGLNFQEIVASVSGQEPNDIAARSDATIHALQTKIEGMERQLGTVTTSMKTDRAAANLREVEDFAADKPRFEELSENIAKLLETGMASDVPEAYSMAERLNPAPVAETPAAQPRPDPKPATQTRNLSISGAPTGGSNPSARKVSASLDEALDNAFASIG